MDYGAFTGAFSLLATIIGVATSILHYNALVLGSAVMDFLATIFYLAASIDLTALYTRYHRFEPFEDANGHYYPGAEIVKVRIGAVIGFCWIGVIFGVVLLVVQFLSRRSRDSKVGGPTDNLRTRRVFMEMD